MKHRRHVRERRRGRDVYRLVGPNYFYFFIVVMTVMGVVFIFVAMFYKEKTHVRADA